MVHFAAPITDGPNHDTGPESITHQYTPIHKAARSDVYFPLSTPRRCRAPQTTRTVGETTTSQASQEGVHKLSVRTRRELTETAQIKCAEDNKVKTPADAPCAMNLKIHDLPLEIQGFILDHIFGDMHSITPTAASLQVPPKNISSSMRHPRRKAVSELALVSRSWRGLVQERIYRHIRVKGTRAGLAESAEWFSSHMHLTKHVRHIEFWVPVWGEKAAHEKSTDLHPNHIHQNHFTYLALQSETSLMAADELFGFQFKLSKFCATLSQIFQHVQCFFKDARLFTLEGGHCKKSNMIRQFPDTLWLEANQSLAVLPNIRTFAMKGAWNIMREHSDWITIEKALPNMQEWHCSYAKPKAEAYTMICSIFSNMPPKLRHVNISLDGFYSKDNISLPLAARDNHLCERLGRIAPQLESIAYTGKICACFWIAASQALRKTKEEPRLKALEIVVKSCCRPRQPPSQNAGNLMAPAEGLADNLMLDGAGITNMKFIRAFERLTTTTVRALEHFPLLQYVRIRYIDLDSPCALLNPYFQLLNGRCYGLWNEEILELLPKVRPGVEYEELEEGIQPSWRKDDVIVGMIHPKRKPKSIKSSAYKLLADARNGIHL